MRKRGEAMMSALQSHDRRLSRRQKWSSQSNSQIDGHLSSLFLTTATGLLPLPRSKAFAIMNITNRVLSASVWALPIGP